MRTLKKIYSTGLKGVGYTALLLFFYLELLKKLTAIPQNVFDLFNPQEGEILGKSQGHVPYLQAGQREM